MGRAIVSMSSGLQAVRNNGRKTHEYTYARPQTLNMINLDKIRAKRPIVGFILVNKVLWPIVKLD